MRSVGREALRRYQRPAGRDFTIYPDDTVLVSYPRSGNTWIRFMIASLMHPDQEQDFTTTLRWVPDIYREPDRKLRRRPRPRVIKSHEPFDARYPKTIYLSRDPRDVAISYYHYLVHFRPQLPDRSLGDFLDDFVAGRVPYGSWSDHVVGWVERSDPERFLLLRYEDFKLDPRRHLREVANFVGLRYDDQDIARALDQASFARMRKVEQDQLGVGGNDQGRFVRRGESSGWRNEMEPDTAERIARHFAHGMRLAGYT